MGHIKTTPQVDDKGQETGNIGLEITYGGKEAPFGGMDTSAPPAYIAPNCAVLMNGMLVVDNQLACVTFESLPTPVLWGGVTGASLLAAGSFYSSIYGTLNYILGEKATVVTGPPAGVDYTYYMTAWVPVPGGPPVVVYDDTLEYTLYNELVLAVSASLTLPLLAAGQASIALQGAGAVVTIETITSYNAADPHTLTYPGQILTASISGGTGYTPGQVCYVQQGDDASGSVTIDTVGTAGNILTVTLNQNFPFTTTNQIPCVSCGYGYSVGSAALVTPGTLNTSLEITNGASTNTYTVVSPSIETIANANANGTGSLPLIEITRSGLLVQFNTTTFVSSPGSGYAVGDYYYVVQGVDSAAIFLITGVTSSGGIVTGIIVNSGTPGVSTYSEGTTAMLVPVPITQVISSASSILTAMAAAIDGGGAYAADPNVIASVSSDGSSLVLSAALPGAAGNAIAIQDLSFVTGATTPYYYFPARTPLYLSGGKDAYTAANPTDTPPASCVAVGGTLYIGNVGPVILKYIPESFQVSTFYQGVKTLRRFAGSLIGLGMISASGVVNTNQDMMFLWSAAQNLDIWAPVTATGNITGAGFEQLADINDFLTGLIVSNNTAFIIRSQGLSYASALASGTNPYQISHVALGDKGEGGQLPALVTQYNESGVFVGNTDIYRVAGSLTSIGTKIRASFYTTLATNAGALLSSGACSVYIGGQVFPLVILAIEGMLYTFVAMNDTWGQIAFYDAGILVQLLCPLALGPSVSGDGNFSQTGMTLVQQTPSIGWNGIVVSVLTDAVPTSESPSASSVVFGQEEIAFGRDVTIESVYLAYFAVITAPLTITVLISGVVFSTLVINASSPGDIPQETKVFFNAPGIFTAHSPQLSLEVQADISEGVDQFYFTKIQMYGSFDPNQSPV
jgi:hypothetical protein